MRTSLVPSLLWLMVVSFLISDETLASRAPLGAENRAEELEEPAAFLSSLLERADQLREQGKFMAALAQLQRGYNQEPQNAEILWRLALVKVDLGEIAKTTEEKMVYFLDAEKDARAAVSANSDNANAYFVLAVAVGRVSLISGNKTKVKLSRQVKEHAERAIRLNPNHAGAHHLLGRWHYEVKHLGFFARKFAKLIYGGLPSASYEQAVEYFKKAIDLKDEIIHHLHLGRTYIAMGEKTQARSELQRVLSMPIIDPDDETHQAEAGMLLRRLE